MTNKYNKLVREKYRRNYLKDKKFIFGKGNSTGAASSSFNSNATGYNYSTSEDGSLTFDLWGNVSTSSDYGTLDSTSGAWSSSTSNPYSPDGEHPPPPSSEEDPPVPPPAPLTNWDTLTVLRGVNPV